MDERTEQGRSGSILSELVTQGKRVAGAGVRIPEEPLSRTKEALKESAEVLKENLT